MPFHGVRDPRGLSSTIQLRVDLRKSNHHKFEHNFRDTTNQLCTTNDSTEDVEHSLLLYLCFDVQRQDLLARIYVLSQPLGYANLANETLLQLLLYGDKDVPDSASRYLLEFPLNFIHKTDPFDCSPTLYPTLPYIIQS